jgi:hypothetical protein
MLGNISLSHRPYRENGMTRYFESMIRSYNDWQVFKIDEG